jgi:hypothetical protein
MDLSTFCHLVDETSGVIDQWPNELFGNYRYLGLPETGNFTSTTISDELDSRIRNAFVPGDKRIAEQCRQLLGELIHEHILENHPLNPYCEILAKIKDATQFQQTVGNDTCQEWRQAVEYGHLSVKQMSLNTIERLDHIYPEYYAVGHAAARLKRYGYPIERAGDKISLNEAMQIRLVAKIETLLAELGGLFVARQIFNRMSVGYDLQQERYHLVAPKPNAQIVQQPLIPFGYLFQLAVKHYNNGKASGTADHNNFGKAVSLILDYSTLLDVQDFSHFPHFPFVPEKMLQALQRMALAYTLYKIPQVRGSDITKILRGLLNIETVDEPFEKGWTIKQAIEVIDVILNQSKEKRGPIRVRAREVRKLCPSIDGHIVDIILSDVLSHPHAGANQNFSRPTDAPTTPMGNSNTSGADFSQFPLLKYSDQSYILMDRSACSGAFLEAIFSQMRKKDDHFDRDLGKPIERLVKGILLQHNIPSRSGNYKIGSEEGECDIVIEMDEIVILIEVKKKPLTRRARAGSDLSLVLDLAQSLLEAQEQAGNHEMRLLREGYLDLNENGETYRVQLNGRSIERIALSFTDFGSFHDRLFLEKFLNAIIRLKFGVADSRYERQFTAINQAITALQEQSRFLYPADGPRKRPYFNCWFFSLPQLLILLDGVDSPESFRDALWATRNLGNGSGDLCFDIHHAEHIRKTQPAMWEMLLTLKDREVTFLTG